MRAIVRAAGGDLANVVKVTVYLTDMGAFPTVNAVYSKFFRAPLPARVAVQVAALPKGADIEMDAIAWLPPQAG